MLLNRGIPKSDIGKFTNLQYVFHDYKLLTNIDRAVNCFTYHVQQKSQMYVIVDSDCDGFTSAAQIMLYMRDNFPEVPIGYIMHPGKEHGIRLNEIPRDCKLLISPDGGSNDFEEQAILYKNNIDIIVLDHHEYDMSKNTPIIIVNSMNNYPNRFLCGAGVVHKFLQALDDHYGIQSAENYIDICALGEVGDVMELTNLETLSLIDKGLRNLHNPLFKEIVNHQEFSMKGILTPISVAFYVVPLINAVIRSGTMEEKQAVFEAFYDPDRIVDSTKRGCSGQTEVLKEQAVRYMLNAKSRQTKEVDRCRAIIENMIKEKNLLNNKILVIPLEIEMNKNIVGLVANQLASAYNRPTLVLRKVNNNYTGSARNPQYSEVEDMRGELESMSSVDFAMGRFVA